MNTTTTPNTTPLWVYALLAFVATAGFFYINIMSAICLLYTSRCV